jgi:CHAT domain-containing protein/tetratricopeptide (TPR) repeat protein
MKTMQLRIADTNGTTTEWTSAMDKPDDYIAAFYTALRIRAFDRAVTAITQLATYGQTQPLYAGWAIYLTGILADEQERDWAKAEQLYQQVLATDPEASLFAHVQLSLGIALSKQARWAEAIAACEQSAQVWQMLNYPLKQAVVLRQLAVAHHDGFLQGELVRSALDQAIQACRQALAILKASESATPDLAAYQSDTTWYEAMIWNTLGSVYGSAGQWQDARQCAESFLALCQQRNDRFHVGFAYLNLGDAYAMQAQPDQTKARHFYQQARTVFQEFQDAYFELEVAARIGALFNRAGDYAMALGYYQQALTMVETVRANVSSETARSGFFTTVIHIYDHAILAHRHLNNLADAFTGMEFARARTFLDALNNRPAGLETNVIALAALQAQLPTDGIVLEYYTTGLLKAQGGRMTEQQAANHPLYPTARTLLLVITKENSHLFDLGFSPNTLFTGDFEQLVEEHFLQPQIRRTLYAKLIAPVEALLQGKQRLYIIPHGPLHYIPFQALLAADGESLLREGGPEIVYGPSATILFRRQTPPAATPTSACLTIGYNGDDGAHLRFAEAEAGFIAHLAGGQALIGPMTKKAELYQHAPTCRVLHFSCHGEFDPVAPLASCLHIAANETLTGQEIIDNLHLTCDLVTLSACESGLSLVQRSDELYGLLRAFMYAGASALIATLWRVDERSTLIFAEKFYQEVAAGASYAAALKAAQLFLKTLTRPAALAILQRHLTTAISQELPNGATLVTSNVGDPRHLAEHYLKGLQAKAPGQNQQSAPALSTAGVLPQEQAEAIFADPIYWAPFILVGGS